MPRRLLEGGQVLPAKAHLRTHRRRDGHCSDNWLRRYWIPALASLRSLGRNTGEEDARRIPCEEWPSPAPD
jgi:hypothetical protein